MNDIAKAYWCELLPQLCKLGRVTRADTTYVVQYCNALAVVERMSRESLTAPIMVPGPRGVSKSHPVHMMYRSWFDTLSKAADKLGLNPLARKAFKADDTQEGDGFDEF